MSTVNVNPIILSHARIARRTGMWAGLILMVLVGACAVFGVMILHPDAGAGRTATGDAFYVLLTIIQGVVLVALGCNRVSRTITEEQKSGLLDSNRMTALRGSDLVLGYWLGPAVLQWMMGLTLVPFILLLMIVAQLDVEHVLQTQAVMLSTALLLNLLAVAGALTMKRAGAGILIVMMVSVGVPMSLAGRQWSLVNYFVPMLMFLNVGPLNFMTQTATLFTIELKPLYLVGLVQLLAGLALWYVASRKLADPEVPALPRWAALLIFAVLLLLQHGLIWPLWQGHYPVTMTPGFIPNEFTALGLVHAVMLFAGLFLLGLTANPTLRVQAAMLRAGETSPGYPMRSGMVPTAGLAALLVALAVAAHCLVGATEVLVLATALSAINAFFVFVGFALIVDIFRLLAPRQAMSLIALALFILYVLPLILGGVTRNLVVMLFSAPAPAVAYLSAPHALRQEMSIIIAAIIAHGLLVCAAAIVWTVAWRRWTARLVNE